MAVEYVQMSDVSALIPSPFLIQALDDNNDGVADVGVWCGVQKAVATAINGLLGGRYATPFTNPIPDVVSNSAIILACEAIYLRRGQQENPFSKQADAVRAQLTAIGKGTQPLSPEVQRAAPSASVQTAPASIPPTRAPRMS